jgi:hypothetical protein
MWNQMKIPEVQREYIRKYMRKWRAKNHEYWNEYQRKYYAAHPEIARNYREANRDHINEYRRRQYHESTKQKDRARNKAWHALNNGRLTRQPCEVCGHPETEFHHDDYTKPLMIRHLCRKHHWQIHRKETIK